MVFGAFFGALALAQTTGNSSLSLVKDLQSGLFTLTLNDAEGVASFSLEFKTGKLPYSGDLSGCARTKKIDQIAALNDSDLAETIKGRIIDCRGGETVFEISAADARGRAQIKKLGVEPESVPTPPTPSSVPTTPKTAPPEPTPTPTTKAHEVIYPVAELGNCKNEPECKAYCDLAENVKQCLAFAKKYQLLPEEEIRLAEKVLGVKGGPGGCNSRASCESYCNDVVNIEVCIAFAEENGLMKGKELEEAKKVRAAVQSGQKLPGGCRNKTACENYCKNPEHIDECMAFAESSGFLSPEELEQAKKFMPLIKSGQTPGGCKTKDECEAYCESDEHMDECIDFAIKHGMIPEEEKKHIEAFKKAGGKGPGGCKGKQCKAFCENPANQQTCFEWAKESGILKEEDLQRMEAGKQQLQQSLGQMPPEAKECVEKIIGPGGLEGNFFGGPEFGAKIQKCMEQAFGSFGGQMGGGPLGEFGGPNGEFPPDGSPPGGFNGPGGCKGIDECIIYCKDHPDECQGFGPPSGGEDHGKFPGGPGESGSSIPPGFEGGIPSGFESGQHPEGFKLPENVQPGQFTAPPTQEQIQQQFQQQYQQQYEQQYQQQSGGFPPPPTGEFHPPPSPPPTSKNIMNPLSLLLAPFVNLFR